MKVLITGAEGQLGYGVKRILINRNYDVYALGKNDLDITNQEAVSSKIHEIKPEVVIHCAAYTNVDQAEIDSQSAYLVNSKGTKFLVQAAEEVNSKIVYISTDYVFNGKASTPYKPSDIKTPLGVYGKSKSLGEQHVINYSSKYFIIRTAWVYGENGKNFVKTMLKLAEKHNEIKVVNDQIGSPTYTLDLANLIERIIQSDNYGVYHATNSGECTWYEFAEAIFELKDIFMKVTPCTTQEFSRPAPRPQYSVLDNHCLIDNGFMPLRHWKKALSEFLIEGETK